TRRDAATARSRAPARALVSARSRRTARPSSARSPGSRWAQRPPAPPEGPPAPAEGSRTLARGLPAPMLPRDAEGRGRPPRVLGCVETLTGRAEEPPHRGLGPEPPGDLVTARVRLHRHVGLREQRLHIVRAPAHEAGKRHVARVGGRDGGDGFTATR